MKTFIIVSKCSGVIKPNQLEKHYSFHFRGVFAGVYIDNLLLIGDLETKIQKDEEYIIFAKFLKCQEATLTGKIVKYQTLEERFNRS